LTAAYEMPIFAVACLLFNKVSAFSLSTFTAFQDRDILAQKDVNVYWKKKLQ
jgi:hypothetical protein